MPRDITREEANSDWSTSIIEFGETAASVTAGAAVIYRGLSGRKVSRLSNALPVPKATHEIAS